MQNRTTILALHHPPLTPGKQRSDLGLYLTEEEQNEAITRLQPELDQLEKERAQPQPSKKKKISYNVLIRAGLIRQHRNLMAKGSSLEFDCILAAHDHNFSIFNYSRPQQNGENFYNICEVGVGFGGGGLQRMLDFENQQSMGCFCQDHGFALVKCGPTPSIDFSVYIGTKDEKKYRLEFNNKNLNLTRHYPSTISKAEQKKLDAFFSAIQKGIHGYLDFLAKQQAKHDDINSFFRSNISHGKEGVNRVIGLWNYISHADPDNFVTSIQNVYKMVEWTGFITRPTQDSLISFLNQAFKDYYRQNFLSFCHENVPILASISASVSVLELLEKGTYTRIDSPSM